MRPPTRRAALTAAFAVLALLPSAAVAQEPRVGPEHELTTRDTGGQDVALSPGLAVWASGRGLASRPIDAAGRPVGPPRTIAAELDRTLEVPAVAPDPAGGGHLLVARAVQRDPAGELLVHRLRADGAPDGPPAVVRGIDSAPAVAVDPASGEGLVAYGVELPGSDWFSPWAAVVQRLAPGGVPAGPPVVLDDGLASLPAPAVAFNPDDGEFLVAWNGTATVDPGGLEPWRPPLSGGPVMAARVPAGGRGPPLPARAISDAASAVDPGVAYGAGGVAVAYAPAIGEYLVAWQGARGEALESPVQVHGQRLDRTGAEVGADDFRLSDGPGYVQPSNPVVLASDPARGGFLAAWVNRDTHRIARVIGQWLPYGAVDVARPDAVLSPAYTHPAAPHLGGGVLGWHVGRTVTARPLGTGADPGAALVVAGPPGTSDAGTASFTLAATGPAAGLECRLDAGPWEACASPHAVAGLGDGPHALRVRARGADGWVQADPAVHGWRVETEPPDTTITEPPDPRYPGKPVRFEASEPATFECRRDGAEWFPCWSWRDLPAEVKLTWDEGPHVLAVRAVDDGGRRDPSPAVWRWTTDTSPPDTTILDGPRGRSNDVRPRVTLAASEPGSTFECRAGGQWAPCASGDVVPARAGKVEARAIDPAGNVDGTPAEWRWELDLQPDFARFHMVPGDRHPDADAVLHFGGDRSSSFECRVDGGAWAACVTPLQLDGLADGRHEAQVRATDDVGNVQEPPDSHAWTVDTRIPTPVLVQRPPPRTARTDARIAFRERDGRRATFTCRVDLRPERPCASPLVLGGLAAGLHRVTVAAEGEGGAPGTEVLVVGWTVVGDGLGGGPAPAARAPALRAAAAPVAAAAPETVLLSAPEGRVRSDTATFTFRSDDGDAGFECRELIDDDTDPCTSPYVVDDLFDGPQGVEITAVRDGVRDPTPVIVRWDVNARPPGTQFEEAVSGYRRVASARFDWSAQEGSYEVRSECRLDGADWRTCEPPLELPALAEGEHELAVRYVDADGQVDPTPEVRRWLVDTVTALVELDRPPAVRTRDPVTLAFRADRPGATFECRLDDAAWAPCASPVVAGAEEGGHTFAVRALRGGRAGNVERFAWVTDRTAPNVRIVAPEVSEGMVTGRTDATLELHVDGLGGRLDAAFGFQEDEASFTCRLDGAPFHCDGVPRPVQLRHLADGVHVLEATVRDSAGNEDPTPARLTWTVDADEPATAIAAGPPPLTAERDATITLRGTPEPDGFECRLDAGRWESCAAEHRVTGLADGTHRLEARAVLRGRADATPATWTWEVDGAPVPAVLSGPPALTREAAARLTLAAGEPGARLECRLDAGAWAPCGEEVVLTGLRDGLHRLEARATDAAGRAGAAPAPWEWTVDTVAPAVGAVEGPEGLVAANHAELRFAASEAGVTFECRLAGHVWERCTSPHRIRGIPDGPASFSVRATDAAGNVSAPSAARTWRVDATPPAAAIAPRSWPVPGPWDPPRWTKRTSADFAVTSPEGGARLQCRLDGGGWTACGDPHRVTAAEPGPHRLRARAVDAAGNTGEAVHVDWVVGVAAPPDTELLTGPAARTEARTARFELSRPDGVTGWRCSLDGAAPGSCDSPVVLGGLRDGAHVLEVAAVDADGDADPTPARHEWVVGPAAPETRILDGPAGISTAASASFAFGSTPAGAAFECALDGAAFVACAGRTAFDGLGEGAHELRVRAVAAGSADPTPAVHAWRVDTTAPATAVLSRPPERSRAGAATVEFAADEPGAQTECAWDGGPWQACASPVRRDAGDGRYELRLRSRDAAGNVEAGGPVVAWEVDTVGPRLRLSRDGDAIGFTGDGTALAFECAVDGGPWTSCVSPWRGRGGVLAVRAADDLGNLSVAEMPIPGAAGRSPERPAPRPPGAPAGSGDAPPPGPRLARGAAARLAERVRRDGWRRLRRAAPVRVRAASHATVVVRSSGRVVARGVTRARPVMLLRPRPAARGLRAGARVVVRVTRRPPGGAPERSTRALRLAR